MSNSTASVDLEHPWLGLNHFRESHARYFFGRKSETEELLLRLENSPLTVFYGRSGFGKTSLLHAGLIPKLKDAGKVPALVRINCTPPAPSGDKGSEAVHLPSLPALQLVNVLFPEPRKPLPAAGLPEDELSLLWLHRHRKDREGGPTHLIIDQFEEIFRGGAALPRFGENLLRALILLLEGYQPEGVLTAFQAKRALLSFFDVEVAPLPILLVLREDWVFALNRWRTRLPSLGANEFELLPLKGTAALEAIYEPGALRTHCRAEGDRLVDIEPNFDVEKVAERTKVRPIIPIEQARNLVRQLANAPDRLPMEEIDAVPPLLSLVCEQLNADRFKTPEALRGNLPDQVAGAEKIDCEGILRRFYQDSFAGRPSCVQTVIEDELLSGEGFRESGTHRYLVERLCSKGVPKADAAKHLEQLVERRLLTYDESGGEPRIELTHDVLCQVAAKSKFARAEREAKERAQWRARAILAVAIVLGLILAYLCFTGYTLTKLHRRVKEAEQVILDKQKDVDKANEAVIKSNKYSTAIRGAALAAEQRAIDSNQEVVNANRELAETRDKQTDLAGKNSDLECQNAELAWESAAKEDELKRQQQRQEQLLKEKIASDLNLKAQQQKIADLQKQAEVQQEWGVRLPFAVNSRKEALRRQAIYEKQYGRKVIVYKRPGAIFENTSWYSFVVRGFRTADEAREQISSGSLAPRRAKVFGLIGELAGFQIDPSGVVQIVSTFQNYAADKDGIYLPLPAVANGRRVASRTPRASESDVLSQSARR